MSLCDEMFFCKKFVGYFFVCNWLYVPVELMKLGVNEVNQARAAEQIIPPTLSIKRVFLKKPSLKCIGIN